MNRHDKLGLVLALALLMALWGGYPAPALADQGNAGLCPCLAEPAGNVIAIDSEDALRAQCYTAAPGSTLVFDYMDTDAFIPEKTARRVQLMQSMARQLGEPLKAGFDPLALAADLDRLGLRLEENLDPAAIEARYFQGRSDHYHAIEQVHFARAVVT